MKRQMRSCRNVECARIDLLVLCRLVQRRLGLLPRPRRVDVGAPLEQLEDQLLVPVPRCAHQLLAVGRVRLGAPHTPDCEQLVRAGGLGGLVGGGLLGRLEGDRPHRLDVGATLEDLQRGSAARLGGEAQRQLGHIPHRARHELDLRAELIVVVVGGGGVRVVWVVCKLCGEVIDRTSVHGEGLRPDGRD